MGTRFGNLPVMRRT